MGIISEKLARLKLRTTSPDETVAATLTGRGITVELRPDILDRHTAGSLARQVTLTLAAALRGYTRAVAMIRDAAYGTIPTPPPKTPAAARQSAYDLACERITVRGSSPEQYVVVTWAGAATFTVVIEPEAMRHLDHSGLSLELNAALRSVAAQRSDAVRAAYRLAYHGPVPDEEA